MSIGSLKCNGKVIILKIPTGFARAIYFNKDIDFEFVQTITDGIGKKIKLNYTHKYYLAGEACFNEDCQDLKKRYFLSLVDVLSMSNGIGNSLNTWQYQYENALFSSIRKTLLGFKKFTCINNQNNKKDEFLFDYDEDYQILLPRKQLCFYNNIKTKERKYGVYCFGFFNENSAFYNSRYILNYDITEDYDLLSNTTIVTEDTHNECGRLIESVTKTYAGLNPTLGGWKKKVTNTYSYQTLILSKSHQKTVPTKILTTQQYETIGIIITDTLTYNYYPIGLNKGRLQWARKGNTDGSITVTYENYTVTGACGKKTVSAQGCTSRNEEHTYDATQRFVNKIKNSLNHEANFSYDPKTGNILSETDANGLTTTYNYDNFGRLMQINYPDNTVTKGTLYLHTASNPQNTKYCVKITSTEKPDVIVYHDILGREICRKEDSYYYETRYNSKGQIVKTSYPFSDFYSSDTVWNYYTYDNFGRISSEKKPYTYLSYTYDNRKVTITDHLRDNISSYKDYDALRRIIQAKDEGGIINYSYPIITSNNNPRQQITISTNDATTEILFDLWGNRLSVNEPNAGNITSEYNNLNELITQTDANGNVTTYQYDILGRISQKQITGSGTTPLTIQYIYDNYTAKNRGRGNIYQIITNNVVEETFSYNNLSSLSKFEKVIDNTIYTFYYKYTPTGQLETMIYPDGFGVNYTYSSIGKLEEIRNISDESLIYKVHSRNKFSAPKSCEYGNGLITDYTYNPYGLPTQIQTGNIVDGTFLNYCYDYNDRGLMISRSESVVNRLETYEYDNIDRLTKMKYGNMVGKLTTQTFSYHNNGNIIGNSMLGSYTYGVDGTKPHAVTQIDPINSNIISNNQCDVTYNFFNQPTQITEGGHQLLLSYGSNQQRKKKEIYYKDDKQYTHYYINKYYERENNHATKTIRDLYYIYGDNGIVALYIKTSSKPSTTDSMYYIHTDHLGSYCAITNTAKQVRQRNFFDPWGNVVNSTSSQQFTLTNRGFTGHEHYPELKIINMNGRLYDPTIGRFFSPDNYVQNPGFTQNYNRYSYALNNPLKYKDPTGQWYEDYDDYTDDRYDDYADGGNPWNNLIPRGMRDMYMDVNTSGRGSNSLDGRDGRDDRNDWDTRDDYDYDPFGFGGQIQPGDDPPRPPTSGTGGAGQGAASLGGTVWGGAMSWGAAETAFPTKVWTTSLKVMKYGGSAVGAVGLGITGIHTGIKAYNKTDNTSDWVDLGASTLLLGFGLMLTNPVGVGIVVGAGIAYGIYRIGWGEQADIRINEKFGFR